MVCLVVVFLDEMASPRATFLESEYRAGDKARCQPQDWLTRLQERSLIAGAGVGIAACETVSLQVQCSGSRSRSIGHDVPTAVITALDHRVA
jgi:hypothetical protein